MTFSDAELNAAESELEQRNDIVTRLQSELRWAWAIPFGSMAITLFLLFAGMYVFQDRPRTSRPKGAGPSEVSRWIPSAYHALQPHISVAGCLTLCAGLASLSATITIAIRNSSKQTADEVEEVDDYVWRKTFEAVAFFVPIISTIAAAASWMGNFHQDRASDVTLAAATTMFALIAICLSPAILADRSTLSRTRSYLSSRSDHDFLSEKRHRTYSNALSRYGQADPIDAHPWRVSVIPHAILLAIVTVVVPWVLVVSGLLFATWSAPWKPIVSALLQLLVMSAIVAAGYAAALCLHVASYLHQRTARPARVCTYIFSWTPNFLLYGLAALLIWSAIDYGRILTFLVDVPVATLLLLLPSVSRVLVYLSTKTPPDRSVSKSTQFLVRPFWMLFDQTSSQRLERLEDRMKLAVLEQARIRAVERAAATPTATSSPQQQHSSGSPHRRRSVGATATLMVLVGLVVAAGSRLLRQSEQNSSTSRRL